MPNISEAKLNSCYNCENNIAGRIASWVTIKYGKSGKQAIVLYCADCVEKHAFYCGDCDESYSKTHFELHDFSFDSRAVKCCSPCFQLTYLKCQRCETIIQRNAAYSFREMRNCLCYQCHQELQFEAEGRFIHSYSFKPRWNVYRGEKESEKVLTLGVELEVNCMRDQWAKKVLTFLGGEKHAVLKDDGSVDGFEIVTHPRTLESHRNFVWKDFFKEFPRKINVFDASPNGMHVHISRNIISKFTQGKMIAFVNLEENAKFIKFIAERDTQRWAAVNPQWGKVRKSYSTSSRYLAINPQNNATLEFRIFRGTLETSRFFKNLEFCQSVYEFAKETSIKELTYQDYLKFVKEQRKQYGDLFSYCSNGVWLPSVTSTEKKTSPDTTKVVRKMRA